MLVPMYAPSRVAAILKDGQAANRSRQANGRLQVILYMILLAAHLAVVWLLPFFPTQDGPSHVYNLVVYRDLLQGKGAWDRFYVLNERSISNQGFFLIAYPLLSVLTPGAAERAFLSLYVFLLGAGVPLFLRTFGRPALPASFFLFVVVFNRPLLTGFYSNSIGVPLLLLAIAVVWKTRGRSWVLLPAGDRLAGRSRGGRLEKPARPLDLARLYREPLSVSPRLLACAGQRPAHGEGRAVLVANVSRTCIFLRRKFFARPTSSGARGLAPLPGRSSKGSQEVVGAGRAPLHRRVLRRIAGDLFCGP